MNEPFVGAEIAFLRINGESSLPCGHHVEDKGAYTFEHVPVFFRSLLVFVCRTPALLTIARDRRVSDEQVVSLADLALDLLGFRLFDSLDFSFIPLCSGFLPPSLPFFFFFVEFVFLRRLRLFFLG